VKEISNLKSQNQSQALGVGAHQAKTAALAVWLQSLNTNASQQCSQCSEASVKAAVIWFLEAGDGFLLDALHKLASPITSVETMLPISTAIKMAAMMEVTHQHAPPRDSMGAAGLPLQRTSIQARLSEPGVSELGMSWLPMGVGELRVTKTHR